ncbi:uncharacterized protein PAC_17325 [Phialocephala subalpina]|uniref:Uncharacterized protein n=1 Tax=Phialocephala subalpina TaxID=576137 RepID=A0A1L7XQU4_9HELO|nr:uncharacterized protein PAC_17325 [Phialocephala subalpina]
MRRRIFQDLPRMNRSFDPNRIVLELPPEFLSPQPSINTGKDPEMLVDDPEEEPELLPRVSLHEFSYDLRSPNATNGNVSNPQSQPGTSFASGLVPSNLMTTLGAGRIDPFANFPIKMNGGDLWLIDQVNTGEDPTFKTLRDRWLPVAVRDAATFHQFLANVSLNISRVRGENLDNAVSIAHHSLAIRSVNQKLSDPNLRTSGDVIASILCFVCYSTVKGDFHGISVHLDGLQNVLRLRGGYKSIKSDPVLVNIAYGVDMTRSLRQDTKPQFPLPEEMLQAVQNDQSADDFVFFARTPYSAQWREIFPPNHPMMSVFDELQHAVEVAKLKAMRNQQWRIVNFVIFRMYPTIHRLLSMGLDPDPDDQWSIVQEASRLGILLFMGEIRRKCGALGVSTRLYITKLKVFMEGLGSTIDWTSANMLLLWVMFFALLESWKLPEQDWYVESMHAVMARTTLRSWDAVLERVKSFLWVDDIYDERVELFRGVISSAPTRIDTTFEANNECTAESKHARYAVFPKRSSSQRRIISRNAAAS